MADAPSAAAGTPITRRDADKTFDRPSNELHTFLLRGFIVHRLEMADVHFHFDSAVMLPDHGGPHVHDGDPQPRITGLTVIAKALTHARDNPAQKLLVAGHTDTSGGQAYNVQLSQLRADNVLHVLRGEREPWVASCRNKHQVEDYQRILTWAAERFGFACDPGGIDNRHGPRTTEALRRFQADYNAMFGRAISVDGQIGDQTWGAFFDCYMAGLKDTLEVDDAGLAQLRAGLKFIDAGKPGVGCGEHFPIDAQGRDGFRSQTNRRVELLFFDPGEEPQLRCHPSAGVCQHEQCELYSRQPRLYEFRPIPPEPTVDAKLEIIFDRNDDKQVDGNELRTNHVRIGLWDHAFDRASGALLNAAGEPDNFVGADTRRLYFRVRDPQASGTVQIDWWTEHGSDNSDDDKPATRSLTLTETAGGSGVFVSRAVMLVTDDVDAGQATDSGLTSGETGPRNRGQSNHRLRKATVDDNHRLDTRVVAEYRRGGSGAPVRGRADLFLRDPEERKRLRVHLVNLAPAPGQAGVLTTARRDLAIRTFREIYARCGIFVEFDEINLVAPAECANWVANYPASAIAQDPSIEGFGFVGGNLIPSASQAAVINLVRARPDFDINDVYLVYVQRIYDNPVPAPSPTAQLVAGSGGEAFPDTWVAGNSIARSFGFVGLATGITEYADVHEATHITTNLRNDAGGHFDLGASAAAAEGPFDGKNLMHRFFLTNARGVANPKRLWNETFRNTQYATAFDIPPQVDGIRASRFVRDL